VHDENQDPGQSLAARQWAEWRISRRGLLKAIGLSGGAIAAAGLAGNLRGFGTSAFAQDASATPVVGGSLSMSLSDSDATSFDPPVPNDNMSIWTMLLFYDQLVRPAADGKSLEPGLATEWSNTPDGLTYTFKLRDAKFHDGTPVTAEDVAYCINRAATLQGSGWTFIFSAIDKIETPDPKTVVFHLKSAWAPFAADLALFGASVFPKAAHTAQGDKLFDKPIGSGPYIFDSWDKGNQIVLKKNPNYWEPGKPYLDTLTFKVIQDSNARMLQFQGGDLDIATSVPYNQIDALKSNPKYTYIESTVARIDQIAINVTRKPFDDKVLRQAINYAVNKDAIIQNVLFGAAKPANTFLPLMAFHDDAAPGYPYDLDKAKTLVAQSAGKDGFAATLWSVAGDSVGAQVCQLVASDLSQIGGNIKLQSEDGNANLDRVYKTRDFDMNIGYYTTDIIDPDELTGFAVLSDGGTMAIGTGYKNDAVDALIHQSETELDPAKRQDIYNQIQTMHADDAPFIFLFYPGGRTVTSNKVKNFSILPTGNYRLWEVWKES
jgi:peptide/nickel transport system substrate-binding protein